MYTDLALLLQHLMIEAILGQLGRVSKVRVRIRVRVKVRVSDSA